MKYEIMYGNRRLEACRKLGHQHIEAKVLGDDKTKLIQIADIETKDNMRTELISIAPLMESIRDRGLLEPIGICIKGDITDVDFLLYNATENIHREDITMLELGKLCYELIQKGMNRPEIAAKLNISVDKVRTSVDAFQKVPESARGLVGSFSAKGSKKKGKLPPTIVTSILSSNLSKSNVEMLLKKAKTNEWTVSQVNSLKYLIKQGLPVEEAVQKLELFDTVEVVLMLHKETAYRLMKQNNHQSFTELIRAIVRGEITGTVKLLGRNEYQEKKKKKEQGVKNEKETRT